jgi:non-specific serine/threonine protein kinase
VRVLIAEDSEIERMILQEAVEGLGHECVSAADGMQAWELFKRSGADVLVSDWLMPGLEGPELCRRVRAHPSAPYTYIILLTALEDKDSTLTGMAAGADDYLTKPLDVDELEARLVAAARVTALHQQLSGRAAERERSLARRQALLGLARRLAADADPDRMLSDLLTEATLLLGGAGGLVSRWDEGQRVLVPVRQTIPIDPARADSHFLHVACARSVLERSVLVSAEANPGSDRPRPTIAAPLLYQDRLVGAIAVAGDDTDDAFPAEAADVFEQLASIGAAALVGLDRARMDGAFLAMQTLHEAQPGRAERAWPNLPAQATALIGRERELEQVRALLLRGDTGLVTLTGPAGIGKTRLAIAVAATLVEAFDRRVAFVDLLPVTESRQVLPTVAQALGGRGVDDERAGEWLCDSFAHVPVLLVLDNAEHLLEAAPDIAALVRECPRLKVLVTSREALHLQVEKQVPVPPLALADLSRPLSLQALERSPAVTLFVQRAQAADPTFRLTEENAPLVAEICARLDGLPLAIELAAARTRVLPAWSLPARLKHQPLAVLTGGLRDQPARHQTLREAIAWSYTLLTADERRQFRQLGVFVGGFTLAAAAAVAEIDHAQVSNSIGALVAKSLVGRFEQPGGEPRFSLLETIRQYALEQLTAEGERDAAHERHVQYCLGLAERAEAGSGRAEQAAWLDRLEREHDNLRVAIRWCAQAGQSDVELRLVSALAWYWDARGHAAEGRAIIQRGLERAGAGASASSRAAALRGAAMLACSDGDWSVARSAYQERLDVGGRDAATLAGLALTHARLHERGLARGLADEALHLAEEVGDRRGAALALRVLGDLATERGAFVQAQSAYADSLAIWHAFDDRLELARTLDACAMLASVRTHGQRALRLAGAAATLRAATGASRGREVEETLGRWLHVARQSLSDQAATALEAEGWAMTPEQAIELAEAPVEPELSQLSGTEGVLHPLSERESQVAGLVARGWTNRQIATELHLSERTVEAHLRRILNRLGFSSRTPLAAWVAQHGGLRAS